MSTIRSRLTSSVVYQSEFVRDWWARKYGPTRVSSKVIYNGVDLDLFSPGGAELRPDDRWVILVVEGRLGGGYELGLEHALELSQQIGRVVTRPVQLSVVGRADQSLIDQYSDHPEVDIRWFGAISHEQVPLVDRSAHLLFAADIHPACPNAVLEALACGTPVVAFDTGAIPELVTDSAGQVVPYGGDPWRLEYPDFSALAEAAVQVLRNQKEFRAGARRRAEDAFGLDPMVQRYVRALGLTV
jgi:glycosyltransferase involved in cell wall biosynthesis